MKTETVCSQYYQCAKKHSTVCSECPDRIDIAPDRGVEKKPALSGDRIEFFLMIGAGLGLACGLLAGRFGMPVLASVCYVLTYLSGGWKGSIKGLQSIRAGKVDVDLLMILAALGAAVVGAPFEGGMLLFLFSLSNVLQDHALKRSRTAIRSLMQLRPSTVRCEVDGEIHTFPVEEVEVGMVVRLRPGDRIALDGEILSGETTVDESSLTGESLPVLKLAGATVFAGTINQNGSVSYRVNRSASDSTLARIIALVEEAQEEKAQTQRFLEKAERYYASSVILLTLALIAIPPLLFDSGFGESFYRAMTILVVASPCALVISTPAAFLAAIAGAARKGVLFKGGVHMERLASVETVAFDKTGTLTTGKPVVTDVVPCPPCSGTSGDLLRRGLDLLQLTASLESHSEHPIARAIESHCMEKRCSLLQVDGFQSYPGKGAEATVAGMRVLAGTMGLMTERGATIESSHRTAIEGLLGEGKTVVVVAEIEADGAYRRLLGWIAVADQVREDAIEAVRGLKRLGIRRLVMLTGDNEKVAHEVARRIGIDEVYAQLLPEAKLQIVRDLSSRGSTAMVGDGVNDAPALAKANVGIAMGAAGSDVAMETADVVLMSSRLTHLLNAFALAKKCRVVVAQNLIFALGVIIVLVSFALLGDLPLPLGVVGHEGSTVLVCLNGLRLLAFKHRG
ncbi:MAG: Zinc-transporting ATPase [Verrucomicrobia bacterium ADurb.Bin474]|nr:MAG: Zinc-transporting ATPase [Verrucomicrobia bacterium ADurb.Bin474]